MLTHRSSVEDSQPRSSQYLPQHSLSAGKYLFPPPLTSRRLESQHLIGRADWSPLARAVEWPGIGSAERTVGRRIGWRARWIFWGPAALPDMAPAGPSSPGNPTDAPIVTPRARQPPKQANGHGTEVVARGSRAGALFSLRLYKLGIR